MSLEVELKAPIKDGRKKAQSIGAKHVRDEINIDTYYTHPCRDFRKTDEALRLRQKEDMLYITYKGPKKDSDLKARKEIEFQVPEEVRELLESLGFKKSFTISKKRGIYTLDGLTICCDLVNGLGEYVEVESDTTSDHDKILDIMQRLGVKESATTKTYSELLNL